MDFLQSIFTSFQNDLSRLTGDIPYKIESFCIGSGSNFDVYLNISINRAEEIYKRMLKTLPLGTLIENKSNGGFIFETYYCLESHNGRVHCFMFPLSRVVYFNPNGVLDEYLGTLEKQRKFKSDLLNFLVKKHEEK